MGFIKSQRAHQLYAVLSNRDWTDEEFWEVDQILRSTKEEDMDRILSALHFTWSAIEGDRIANGTHHPCPPELAALLAATWPTTGG